MQFTAPSVRGGNRTSLASLTTITTSVPAVNTFHRTTLSASAHGIGLFPPSDNQTPDHSRRNSDEEDEQNDQYNVDLPPPNRRHAV
jgi:hypothetical protein